MIQRQRKHRGVKTVCVCVCVCLPECMSVCVCVCQYLDSYHAAHQMSPASASWQDLERVTECVRMYAYVCVLCLCVYSVCVCVCVYSVSVCVCVQCVCVCVCTVCLCVCVCTAAYLLSSHVLTIQFHFETKDGCRKLFFLLLPPL